MRSTRNLQVLAVVLCAISFLLVPSVAVAAAINYGDFMGSSVWFRDVAEDSVTDDTPLYGMPEAVGNSLDFDPISFGAFASLGSIDVTDGALTMGVEAKQDVAINGLIFSETGDFSLSGFGTLPNHTMVSVRSPFFVDILEVDGVGITPIKLALEMSVQPLDGIIGLDDLGGGPIQGGNWEGELNIDIKQALIDEGVDFNLGATRVSVVLNNTLTAISETGTTALIAKKDFGGTSITVVIPEPSTLLLTILAVAGLLGLRRGGRLGG